MSHRSSGAAAAREGAPRAAIDSIALSGSGCPDPSHVSLARDGSSFDVRFDHLGMSADSEIAECSLFLGVTPPHGYRVTIASFTLEGRASLPADATVELMAFGRFRTPPLLWTIGEELAYAGPHEDTFSEVIDAPPSALRFEKCGAAASIQIGLLATLFNDGSAPASFDIERLHAVRFALEKCA